jgi:hypothetical protein
MRKGKVEITFETQQIVTIASTRMLGWCDACCRHTLMITVEEASVVCELSMRKIDSLIAGRQIHFQKNSKQRILVCFNSLIEFTDPPGVQDPN